MVRGWIVSALEVGDRPALPHLAVGSFDERFEFGLAALLDGQPSTTPSAGSS